jgi:hypothetical protein
MFLVGFILTLGRGFRLRQLRRDKFRLALSSTVSNPPKLTTLHYKVVRLIRGTKSCTGGTLGVIPKEVYPRKMTFQEEFGTLWQKHEATFDERYLSD